VRDIRVGGYFGHCNISLNLYIIVGYVTRTRAH